MHNLPGQCPFCGGELVILQVQCRDCGTRIEGRFSLKPYRSAFDRLTPEQLRFLEIFIRNEGKFSRMEKELGLSYPTLRNRLRAIIRAMGFSTEEAPAPREPAAQERTKILDDLEAGRISVEEALDLLRGEGSPRSASS